MKPKSFKQFCITELRLTEKQYRKLIPEIKNYLLKEDFYIPNKPIPTLITADFINKYCLCRYEGCTYVPVKECPIHGDSE